MRYLISDIHGASNTLAELISTIEKEDTDARYLFMGDYVDRNLNSFETIEFLIDLAKRRECVFLRGNHDDIFEFIVTGETPITNVRDYVIGEPNRQTAYRWLNQYGLKQTVDSYARNGYDISDVTKITIPDSHRQFFKNLQLIHIETEWFATHAWFPLNEEIPREDRFLRSELKQDLLWGRFNQLDFAKSNNWNGRRLYIGHTPTINYHGVHEPYHTANVSLLDTGSFIPGGALTAYCPCNSKTIIVPTHSSDR